MSKQHKYENMALDDRDDRSSTEVESLMEETKQWHDVDLERPIRRSRASRICAVLSSWRWLIDTALLLIILGFVVRSYYNEPVVRPYDFTGDVTGFGPKCKLLCATVYLLDERLTRYSLGTNHDLCARGRIRTI